jgi:thiamine biosynthesis lipoprotein
VLGGRADGSPWTVGVENPDRETADYVVTVGMTDGSLVTSGDYQRYYTVDGKKYHHLIDLESGLPASYFRSTTVFCADSGLADALSTALFLMPLSEGQTLVDSLAGVEALWVLENGETVMTDGMTEMRNDQ